MVNKQVDGLRLIDEWAFTAIQWTRRRVRSFFHLGRGRWYFPILDARGEFFLGAFAEICRTASAGQDYEPADAGWVLKPESLRAFLEERLTSGASATCLVRAHDQAAVDLRASLPASLNWQQVEGALVDSIADIARREEQSSRPCPDAKLDAYYIRRPDAEINWKD